MKQKIKYLLTTMFFLVICHVLTIRTQALTIADILSQAQSVRESIKPMTAGYFDEITENGHRETAAGRVRTSTENLRQDQVYPNCTSSILKETSWYLLDSSNAVISTGNALPDNITRYPTYFDFTLSKTDSYILTGTLKSEFPVGYPYPSKIELTINQNTFTLEKIRTWTDAVITPTLVTTRIHIIFNTKWVITSEETNSFSKTGILQKTVLRTFETPQINIPIDPKIFL